MISDRAILCRLTRDNSEAVDLTTYGRQRDKVREELTLQLLGAVRECGWKMVTLNFTSWNQIGGWLRGLEGLRAVA